MPIAFEPPYPVDQFGLVAALEIKKRATLLLAGIGVKALYRARPRLPVLGHLLVAIPVAPPFEQALVDHLDDRHAWLTILGEQPVHERASRRLLGCREETQWPNRSQAGQDDTAGDLVPLPGLVEDVIAGKMLLVGAWCVAHGHVFTQPGAVGTGGCLNGAVVSKAPGAGSWAAMVRARGGGENRSAKVPRADAAQILSSVSDVPVIPATHVLRDYALLADGHRGVLVGPQGDCAWLCFPGWADPAVFASLVGSGGHYLIQPRGRWVWGGYYEDGTLIWVSRWVTENGVFESREALAYPGTPGRAVLLRRVRALDRDGELSVALDPRSDYGRRSVGAWRRRERFWEARSHDLVLRWWGGQDAVSRPVDHHHRLEMQLELAAGAEHDFVLELITTQADSPGDRGGAPDADALWLLTEESWRAEVPDCKGIVAAQDVRRSYAVLRGMTGPEGGTVAAATTSLPERAGGNRNYDYRYVWVRDTCYIGRAGACVPGGEAMLDDAVRWVSARLIADGDQLSPAYLPDGGPVPGVKVLEDLPGYPGGTDVIGNRIRDQFQLDAFGEALLLFSLAGARGRLDTTGWKAAEIAAEAIERRWTEEDSGIWELEPRHWTHSRLICVAGLRALCQAGLAPEQTVRYLALADTILARTASESVHPAGYWQRAPDDPRVDASLLLAELRGALSPTDPRSQATRRLVVDELTEDGHVYRYRRPGSPLGEAEGAFLICNFWLSLASLGAGETVEGVRWFERARSGAGAPGLLAEEFDVVQHQLRGNLPQAFVHAALIECAAAQEKL